MTLTPLIVQTCLEALPSRVNAPAIEAATLCLVDSLAVAYAAYNEAPINMLRATSTAGGQTGGSSVIGYSDRAQPAEAALVNGTMISLQLFDDNHELMRGHPSAPLLPAVLALGEVADVSLAQALNAFVVGYEVECRLGQLLNPSHYEFGWHATATQGTMAATVASGLLLKLDAQAMSHALGIAASLASGIRRNFGSMTMSFHSGHAASSGVRAAQLAQQGFTADPMIFDKARGFGPIFSLEWSPEEAEKNLALWGLPFMLLDPGPAFKLFPCGRPNLFGIDAAMEIQKKHGINHADVKRIICDVSYMYPRTVIHSRPTNGFQGKTSLEYCIAATLVDHRPTLASFTDEAVMRPVLQDLVDRTEMRVPAHLSEDVPAVRKAPFEQPVTVTVQTHDGRSLSHTIEHHKGAPKNPASVNDLRQKFVDCASAHLPTVRVQGILDHIATPGVSVRSLMALLPVH
jgi:2-methylcitrate dehydratase PrpD